MFARTHTCMFAVWVAVCVGILALGNTWAINKRPRWHGRRLRGDWPRGGLEQMWIWIRMRCCFSWLWGPGSKKRKEMGMQRPLMT